MSKQSQALPQPKNVEKIYLQIHLISPPPFSKKSSTLFPPFSSTFTIQAPTSVTFYILPFFFSFFTPFTFPPSFPPPTSMPKPDLETLFRSASGGAAGDRRVSCETVLQTQLPPGDEFPDSPPESFQVPPEEELEWYDRNAFVVGRSSSTKGSFNPSTFPGVKSNSSSRRGSVKSRRASIIGLPKLPDSGQLRRSIRRNCPPQGIRLTTKRAARRDPLSGAEPGSPKVSCLGRVRSKSRSRRCRSRREPAAALAPEGKVPAKKKSAGFWGPIEGIFRLGRRGRKSAADSEGKVPADPSIKGGKPVAGLRRSSVAVTVETAASAAAPVLGGMKRFASGRRPASWGEDEVEAAVRQAEQSPEA